MSAAISARFNVQLAPPRPAPPRLASLRETLTSQTPQAYRSAGRGECSRPGRGARRRTLNRRGGPGGWKRKTSSNPQRTAKPQWACLGELESRQPWTTHQSRFGRFLMLMMLMLGGGGWEKWEGVEWGRGPIDRPGAGDDRKLDLDNPLSRSRWVRRG